MGDLPDFQSFLRYCPVPKKTEFGHVLNTTVGRPGICPEWHRGGLSVRYLESCLGYEILE